MYKITSGLYTIYDSTNPTAYPIKEPALDLGLNEAGSLEFSILPSHALYDTLHPMKTYVKVYKDTDELFYGRIITVDKDLYGIKKVHCEGAYTFLIDSEMEAVEVSETIPEFIDRCLTAHNGQVEASKQFTPGLMTADKAVEIDSTTGEVIKIDFKIQDYSTTKNVLDSLVLSPYGGFFRIRPNPNGPYYLDYIQTYGRTNTQRVKIAENVVDKNDNETGENLFSILRPLGKDGLTIETLTQADVTLPNVVIDGKTLRLTDAIADYGSIIHTEKFSNIDDAALLLKAAEEFITRRGSQIPASSEIGFVNWHLMNPNEMDPQVGDTFTTIDGFDGISMTVGNRHYDLEDPGGDSMTMKNPEMVASEDPTSSSGSLSASYASQCTHIDYVYKYINEQENTLILHTKLISINAEELELAGNEIRLLSDEVNDPVHGIEAIAGKLTVEEGKITQIMGSDLWINRNNITAVTGEMEVDSNNIVHIKTGSGLKIDYTDGVATSSFGVYDQRTLTAGVVVGMINGQSGTYVRIAADTIDLSGYVTANQFETQIGRFYNATSDLLSAHNLYAIDGNINSLYVASFAIGTSGPLSIQTVIIDGVTHHYLGID